MLRRNMKKEFSKEDIEYIKEHYKDLTYSVIGEVLKHPRTSIATKVRELGLKKRELQRWTEADSKWLVKNYGTMPNSEIAIRLNRCVANVFIKAKELSLSKNYSRAIHPRYWRDEMLAVLIKNYGRIPNEKLADMIGCTPTRLFCKAKRLGLVKD